MGFDGQVHTNPTFNFYSDLSIWDIYRSQFPLLTFWAPQVAVDVMKSMLAMQDMQGNNRDI